MPSVLALMTRFLISHKDLKRVMKKDDFLTTFFSFKENPFSLTPDPKYLFLGEKHREVLAHLTFGVREDKGFMVVVGEVGTGKTTLCRAFINHLFKENVEVGLIYNPALSDLEMLQAINREFKLPSDLDSKGKLIDALNAFLVRVNGENRQVVLIVDEAQNLDTKVLEQLRLISNLETDTGKLIQIILVGQPELEKLLSKQKLRQLDQRIVVRSFLEPFNTEETVAYIRHRIQIATNSPTGAVSFSDGACRSIHKISGGIPRLINALSYQVLLVAYIRETRHINRSIIRKAHRDFKKGRFKSSSNPFSFRLQTAVLFFLLIFVSLGWLYQDSVSEYVWNVQEVQPIDHAPVKYLVPPEPVIQKQTIEIPQEKPPEINNEDLINRLVEPLTGLSLEENWVTALKSVFSLWSEPWLDEPGLKPGDLPEASKLNIFELYGNLTVLKSINYPAILELKTPEDHSTIYVVLKKFAGDSMVLVGEEEINIPTDAFIGLWYGRAFILWKDFEELPRSIYPGTKGNMVIWLQKNLKILNLFEGPESGVYDDQTVDAVIRLQKKNNLFADGIVGPQTKRTLYSLLDVYQKPTLVSTD